MVPKGAVRAGDGGGLLGGGRHGALVLLAEGVAHGAVVRGAGAAAPRGGLGADGLHARAEEEEEAYK